MPPTTLPAPEIKIGLRLPVNCILPRIRAGKCEPVHTLAEIWRGAALARSALGFGPRLRGFFHRMSPGPERLVASGRCGSRFVALGARERLPQTLDRLGEAGYLLGQPFAVGLLRGKNTPDGLQLILDHLQLVDRFLLGRFQALGLLDQLLGGLHGPGLNLAGSDDAIQFRRRAGIGAPERNRGDAEDDDEECCGGKCDRLRADACEVVGSCVAGGNSDHETAKPKGKFEGC
jgi:hypothetical protein